MAVLAAIESARPLHRNQAASRAHLGPNLLLTLIAFVTNFFLNAMVIETLAILPARGLGMLNRFPQPAAAATVAVILWLDFAFYLSHVAMHKVPLLWRYHRVHHSDPFVDLTTTIRQHPGDSLIRYAFLAPFAFLVGASPGAFTIYRTWSAVSAFLEHANLRLPLRLDSGLALLVTSPHSHKVHHSRRAEETDSNYGNIFTLWDRLFSTFTPSARGLDIPYGLDGFDAPHTQALAGLLRLPFQAEAEPNPPIDFVPLIKEKRHGND